MKLKLYSLLFAMYFILPISFRELIVRGVAYATVDLLLPYGISEARIADVAVGVYRAMLLSWTISLPIIAYVLFLKILMKMENK